MATKGKEVKEPVVEPKVVEPIVGPEVEQVTEPKTFTQEDVDTLIAEAKGTGKTEAFEDYKGIQRTVSEKAAEIQRLKSQLGQPRSGSLKTLLEKLAKRGADSYDPTEQAEIGQLLSQYGQEEQYAAQQAVIGQKREEFTQKIADAGLDPNDEQFDSAWDAFRVATRDGEFETAEKRITRVLSKVKPSEPVESKGKETEEQMRERLTREIYDKEGLTLQPAGSPPAGGKRSYSAGEIGDMSYAEWVKAGKPDARRE